VRCALPLAALVLYALLLNYFAVRPVLVPATVVEGLLTAFTPILIVWGTILLFNTMGTLGAMAAVWQWLNGITTNRVAQFLVEHGIDSISLNPDTVLKTTLAILETERAVAGRGVAG